MYSVSVAQNERMENGVSVWGSPMACAPVKPRAYLMRFSQWSLSGSAVACFVSYILTSPAPLSMVGVNMEPPPLKHGSSYSTPTALRI